MSCRSLLALSAWALLSACGSVDLDSEASRAPGLAGGSSGSGASGSGNATGPGGGSGAGGTGAGGAGGGAGPVSGSAGSAGSFSSEPSEACKVCVRGVCLNCPEGDLACEPCSVDEGLCHGPPSSESMRLCICEDKCVAECRESFYCATLNVPPGGTDISDTRACVDNLPEDQDGLIDCDAPRCADACVSPCFRPPTLSVGTDGIQMEGRWKGHANVLTPPCALDPQSGPDILYEVTSAVTGFLRVSVSSEADALVSVRTGCQQGTELYCRNDVGASGSEVLTFPVAAGKPVWVAVGAAKPLTTATYQLAMTALEAKCHNGVVTPDEECDDDGDASCVECQLAACKNAKALTVGEIAVPPGSVTTSVQPSCVPLDHTLAPEHVYAVRADADGRFEAVLRSGGKDLTLSVRSSCQATGAELGCSDEAPGGDGAVERLVVPTVKGQTFYVVVESFDGKEPGDYTLWTRSSGLVCSDGGGAGVTEQCDLGKGNGGECTERCTTRLPTVAQLEQEPNNLVYQAATAGSEVGGEIFPPGDVDLYRLEIAKDGPFVVSIEGATGESACEASLQGGLLDSELRLRTLDGALVARNDNAVGVCSRLSLSLTKGTYLLEVRASSGAPDQVFSYLLRTASGVTPQP